MPVYRYIVFLTHTGFVILVHFLKIICTCYLEGECISKLMKVTSQVKHLPLFSVAKEPPSWGGLFLEVSQ